MTKLRRTAIGPWRDPGPLAPPGFDPKLPVRGAALYPWCASVDVSQRDLDRLRAGQGIALRPVRPPDWTIPDGFPDPAGPIRALLDGFIVAMLRERGVELHAAPVLRGPL